MLFRSHILLGRLCLPWWRSLVIFLNSRMRSPSWFLWYVFNVRFAVGVVLNPPITLPHILLLQSTPIVLAPFDTIPTRLLFQPRRSLSTTLGGPVNALAVAAQVQLEVAQVAGPRLDRDIWAYLHLVGSFQFHSFVKLIESC